MSKTYIFHINGMHCKSCVFLTESDLQEYPGVVRVKSSLVMNTVEITGDFGKMSPLEIAKILTKKLEKNGYSLSLEKKQKEINWKEFRYAFPIAFGVVLLFFLLQKVGIINLVQTDNITFGTAFLIGIIASLSTCMAVVGGLLLSMSATYAAVGDTWKPQLLFHIGRLLSFFFLGGVIGLVGTAFQLTSSTSFLLGLLVGLVMLVLGINLLDIFDSTKKFHISPPKFLAEKAHTVTQINHSFTPFLIGIVTFFLPCGFTQSMQIYTLSTGNFFAGGLTMLSFALGTLPVLALISFSSFSIQNTSHKGVFFKSAGLIVILFALFNILNSFISIGILPPLFSF